MIKNNIIKYGFLGLSIISLLGACNDIPEADRFIEVEPVKVNKVTLIQEFTGMWCTNCPEGARTVHEIQETYPGSVIAVNMHPENTSFTRPLNGLSLTCPEATVMYNYYNPVGFPAAVIDGVGPNSSMFNWAKLVEDALQTMTTVGIGIDTSYDPATRELKVNYDINFTDNYLGDLSVMIWVMENDIKGWQIDNGTPDKNYSHNHVLRASVNGDWGQTIGSVFEMDQIVSGEASMILDDKWVAENCEVVAYVFQTGTKKVEQATVANAISK